MSSTSRQTHESDPFGDADMFRLAYFDARRTGMSAVAVQEYAARLAGGFPPGAIQGPVVAPSEGSGA